MKVVKYWQVELFQDTGFRVESSVVSGFLKNPIEQKPFFTGYSLRMPKFNVADDQFIEIMASVDDVEARHIRRSLIGSVRVPDSSSPMIQASSYSQFRNDSAFTGRFLVSSVRLLGNSRHPDGNSWVTVLEAHPDPRQDPEKPTS